MMRRIGLLIAVLSGALAVNRLMRVHKRKKIQKQA